MSPRRRRRSTLRDLAEDLEDVARVHPCFSQAHRVVASCCDHLRAMARAHEANAEASDAQAKLEKIERELARVKK